MRNVSHKIRIYYKEVRKIRYQITVATPSPFGSSFWRSALVVEVSSLTNRPPSLGSDTRSIERLLPFHGDLRELTTDVFGVHIISLCSVLRFEPLHRNFVRFPRHLS